MNKMILALTAILSFSFSAQALQCEVSIDSNKYNISKQVKVITEFEQLTTIQLNNQASIAFTVKDVRTSPDTFVQYIEVAQVSNSACKDIALFDARDIYNGIAKTCVANEIPGFELVTISCVFR